MCPELSSTVSSGSSKSHPPMEIHSTYQPSENIPKKTSIYSQAIGGSVLLGTTLVRVKGQHGSKVVRLVFDNGNMQSSIRTSTAIDLGCRKVGEEIQRNVLFGGVIRDVQILHHFESCTRFRN